MNEGFVVAIRDSLQQLADLFALQQENAQADYHCEYSESYSDPDFPTEYGDLSPHKAREILHDGTVHGHPLTERQRRFMGAVASGHSTQNESSDPPVAYDDPLGHPEGQGWHVPSMGGGIINNPPWFWQTRAVPMGGRSWIGPGSAPAFRHGPTDAPIYGVPNGMRGLASVMGAQVTPDDPQELLRPGGKIPHDLVAEWAATMALPRGEWNPSTGEANPPEQNSRYAASPPSSFVNAVNPHTPWVTPHESLWHGEGDGQRYAAGEDFSEVPTAYAPLFRRLGRPGYRRYPRMSRSSVRPNASNPTGAIYEDDSEHQEHMAPGYFAPTGQTGHYTPRTFHTGHTQAQIHGNPRPATVGEWRIVRHPDDSYLNSTYSMYGEAEDRRAFEQQIANEPCLWPQIEVIMRHQHGRGMRFEDEQSPTDYATPEDTRQWLSTLNHSQRKQWGNFFRQMGPGRASQQARQWMNQQARHLSPEQLQGLHTLGRPTPKPAFPRTAPILPGGPYPPLAQSSPDHSNPSTPLPRTGTVSNPRMAAPYPSSGMYPRAMPVQRKKTSSPSPFTPTKPRSRSKPAYEVFNPESGEWNAPSSFSLSSHPMQYDDDQDEQSFTQHLENNPYDWLTRSVFANWLEDHGRIQEAEQHRQHLSPSYREQVETNLIPRQAQPMSGQDQWGAQDPSQPTYSRYADTTEDDFHRMLDENPDDHTTRQVFADWLQEHNDPRAAGYRALGQLGKYPYLADDYLYRWHENDRDEETTQTLPEDWWKEAWQDINDRHPFFRAARRVADDAAAHAFARLPPERQQEILKSAEQPPTQNSRYSDYGLDDQRAFEQQLDETPLDTTLHGGYADWLREQGAPRHADQHLQLHQTLGDHPVLGLAHPNAGQIESELADRASQRAYHLNTPEAHNEAARAHYRAWMVHSVDENHDLADHHRQQIDAHDDLSRPSLPTQASRYADSTNHEALQAGLNTLASREHALTRQGNHPEADMTHRGMLADLLDDHGRPAEAALLRDPQQHVMVHNGQVVPARFTEGPLFSAVSELADHIYANDSDAFDHWGTTFHGDADPVNPTDHEDYEPLNPGEHRFWTGEYDNFGHWKRPLSEVGPEIADLVDRNVEDSGDWENQENEPERWQEYDTLLNNVRNAPFEEPVPQQRQPPTNASRYSDTASMNPTDHPEGRAFHDHIRMNPDDAAARGAYADWLDDHGFHPDLARLQRIYAGQTLGQDTAHFAQSIAPTRYGVGSSDLAQLLKAARSDPDDPTLHGAIADALDEAHPGNQISGLIRRQFGLGEHGGAGEIEPVGEFGNFYNSWDGTFPRHAGLGQHGPFNLYLTHEYDPYDPPENARWIVRAISRLPGSRDTGYNFEFPHEEAHIIPKLFPRAGFHIPSSPYHLPNGGLSEGPSPETMQRAADVFNDRMDEEERNRGNYSAYHDTGPSGIPAEIPHTIADDLAVQFAGIATQLASCGQNAPYCATSYHSGEPSILRNPDAQETEDSGLQYPQLQYVEGDGRLNYADESDLPAMIQSIPTRAWRGWPQSEYHPPFDMTPRLVAADFFDDLGRSHEAANLRDTTRHVYWNGNQVRDAGELARGEDRPTWDENSHLMSALWAERDPDTGEPLDEDFSHHDIHPESMARMIADWRHFKGMHGASPDNETAQDFWLSRNGHGTGFFDNDNINPEDRERLQAAAHEFGEMNLYRGDDGLIHAYGNQKNPTRYADDVSVLLKQLQHPDYAHHLAGLDDPLGGLRGVTADALDEQGRSEEANRLRNPGTHVEIRPNGTVMPNFMERQTWGPSYPSGNRPNEQFVKPSYHFVTNEEDPGNEHHSFTYWFARYGHPLRPHIRTDEQGQRWQSMRPNTEEPEQWYWSPDDGEGLHEDDVRSAHPRYREYPNTADLEGSHPLTPSELAFMRHHATTEQFRR